MREIKFRAWDNDNKVFEYFDFNDLDKTIEKLDSFSDYFSHKYFSELDEETGNQLLQQFTGLHDKNGKEIYEGDIIKLYGWGVSDEYIGTAKIYWDDQFYQWDYEMIDGDLIDDRYDIWRASREVIGNVFENLGLLNR